MPRPVHSLGSGLLAALLGSTALAGDLPTGGQVVAGDVSIATPGPSQMTISQGSNAAVVNWQNFSIGEGARVDIAQPGAQAALLNRVTGTATSQIYGQLNANGQVFVVNPNGIFIGPTGQVRAGGFVASTLDIGTDDFLNGTYRFSRSGTGAAVENAGTIDIVPGGYAALIGGRAVNSGVIRVPLGRAGLAAGERVTLDISGDGFLQVAVPADGDETMDALVENAGRIEANGGQVQMLAASAREAARQVVNMSGVIEARTVSGRPGAVVLGGGGGAVQVTGTIDVSDGAAPDASPRPPVRPGGEITVTGAQIALEGATLDASGGGAGQGGSIRVGGDYQGTGDLQRALRVSVDAASRLIADGGDSGGAGRIIVWSDYFTDFSGSISARGGDLAGDGGFAEVSGKQDLRYRGLADLRAPRGETGMLLLDPTNITVPGTVDVATIESNLATTSVTLNTTGTGLLLIGGSQTDLGGPATEPGDIEINAPITWGANTEFGLIADNDIRLNAAITGTAGEFSLSASGDITTGPGGAVNVGLFSLVNGTWSQASGPLPAFSASDFQIDPDATFLRALGGDGTAGNPYQLTDIYGVQGVGSAGLFADNFVLANDIDATVTQTWDNFGEGFGGFDTIGSFANIFDGAGYAIDGLFSDQSSDGGLFNVLTGTALVTDLALTNADITSSFGGGVLAGENAGTIQNSFVSGDFQGFGGDIGGMVGENTGTIQDSASDVDVSASIFGSFTALGGLAGFNDGLIFRSNSSGVVSGAGFSGSGIFAGGLVGDNAGTVSASYATGNITVDVSGGASATVGGLTGSNGSFLTVTNSYSTGIPAIVGGTGTIGGLVGSNAGAVTNSFWDVTTSGVATSAGGTGLTTAQFQDTQTFLSLATGWDFADNWAPGTTGQYPLNYTTSPVVYTTYNPLSVVYGQTAGATATGSVAGGPGVYVFGPMGDALDTAPVFGSLSFSSETVGASTFVTGVTGLTSALGVTYSVVANLGAATITPAALTITPIDLLKLVGETLVFAGTEFTTTGLVGSDSVDFVQLFSEGAAAEAPASDTPYDIVIQPGGDEGGGGILGSGLTNYDITLETGELLVTSADPPPVTPPVIPPTPIIPPPPNILDEIDTGDGGGGGGGTVVTPAEKAAETLGTIEELSGDLQQQINACASKNEDVGQYLNCLADAMDTYAEDLDRIARDLPPGLEAVGDIIRNAAAGVRVAGEDAQRRLALATTPAQRAAIRREATEASRRAIQTAQAEIRKAITLIRADDPELAGLQRLQVETIVAAVGQAEIGLSRVLEL